LFEVLATAICCCWEWLLPIYDIVKIVAKLVANNEINTNVVAANPNNKNFLLCNIQKFMRKYIK